ncbi:MAG: phosphoribosyl-AMP cyclohydrolase, partial [Chloroflexota bacterium]
HYREDMQVCLGLSGHAVPREDLRTRALRLALGILDLLTPHAAALADQLEPDLPRYLIDGTPRRYLLQE